MFAETLTVAQRADRGDFVGCTAGALSFAESRSGLVAAGFTDVETNATHEVVDGMHSTIVRAVKPATTSTPATVPVAGAADARAALLAHTQTTRRPRRGRRRGGRVWLRQPSHRVCSPNRTAKSSGLYPLAGTGMDGGCWSRRWRSTKCWWTRRITSSGSCSR